MTAAETAALAFGYLALPVALWRFQFMDRRKLLLANALMSAMMAVHYGLIGADTASFVTLCVAVSSAFAGLFGHQMPLSVRIGQAWLAVTMVMIVAPPGVAWEWLPVLGFGAARIGEVFKHDMAFRLAVGGRTSLWLGYAFHLGDPAAMALESLNLLSNVVGIWRRVRRAPAAAEAPRPEPAAVRAAADC